MQDLQEIYNRSLLTKVKIKEIRKQYKDALSATSEYGQVKEKLQGYRLRKLQVEKQVKVQLKGEFETLDGLKKDLESDQQMISDISMAKLMKGETVELQGENDVRYEPVFVVKFRKAR